MKNLFFWEVRKNVKRNAIIGIGVATIVLLILLAVTYNVFMDIFQNVQPLDISAYLSEDGKEEQKDDEKIITKQAIEEYIEYQKSYLKEIDAREAKGENVYSERFAAKSLLISMEYALKNGYYDKPVKIEGFNTTNLGGAEGFTGIYSSLITMIVLIYGVILGAAMYCNEYKSGTIKIVMTRPVTPTALTMAKLLAMYAVLAVMFFVPTLIGFAYGGIAFGSLGSTTVISSFNAMSAFETTLGAITFGTIMNNFIEVIVMATISFALATVTRSSAAGIFPSIAIMFGIGNFLKQTGASAFLLSTSLDFSAYFGIGEVPRYGNFFISLAVVLLWWIISLVASFVVTNKRDVY